MKQALITSFFFLALLSTAEQEIEPPVVVKRKRKRTNLLHELSKEEMEEYEKNVNARISEDSVRDADARARVHSSVEKGTRTTLLIANIVFEEFLNGKGVPLAADDPRQLKFWTETQKHITPKERKILFVDKNGDVKKSPKVSHMKRKGVSSEVAAAREAARSSKLSTTLTGHDQLHAIEGCAINLLLEQLKNAGGDEWIFEPVFDGLQTDFMARHVSFPPYTYVPIQIKSAQIRFGIHACYFLRKDRYEDWMYCIAVGIRNYAVTKSKTMDDTHVSEARIYEIWDLGSSTILVPSPVTHYGPVSSEKRCFFMHEAHGYAKPDDFIRKMLENIKNWPCRFTRDQINYDMDVVNKRINPKKVPEVLGLKELSKVLPGLRAPWRQMETVDSVWNEIAISNKTASKNHGNSLYRRFQLGSHKYDTFCHWVVASYADMDFKKVAVIPAAVVYRNGLVSFHWNESKPDTMKNVELFNLDTDAEAFRSYLAKAPAPPQSLLI